MSKFEMSLASRRFHPRARAVPNAETARVSRANGKECVKSGREGCMALRGLDFDSHSRMLGMSILLFRVCVLAPIWRSMCEMRRKMYS